MRFIQHETKQKTNNFFFTFDSFASVTKGRQQRRCCVKKKKFFNFILSVVLRFLENVVLVRARLNEKKAKRRKQQDAKNVVHTASPLFLMMLINAN